MSSQEIDTSAWPDVTEALSTLDLPADETELLVSHLRDRLVSHFGAECFDVWRAKEGLHRHDAIEVAAIAIAKLAPLLNQLPAGAVAGSVERGELATPINFPWNETFPFG